ncbi:hypothetical protein ACOSQ2_031464 [Xanthoceras sorbifolium]
MLAFPQRTLPIVDKHDRRRPVNYGKYVGTMAIAIAGLSFVGEMGGLERQAVGAAREKREGRVVRLEKKMWDCF